MRKRYVAVLVYKNLHRYRLGDARPDNDDKTHAGTHAGRRRVYPFRPHAGACRLRRTEKIRKPLAPADARKSASKKEPNG